MALKTDRWRLARRLQPMFACSTLMTRGVVACFALTCFAVACGAEREPVEQTSTSHGGPSDAMVAANDLSGNADAPAQPPGRSDGGSAPTDAAVATASAEGDGSTDNLEQLDASASRVWPACEQGMDASLLAIVQAKLGLESDQLPSAVQLGLIQVLDVTGAAGLQGITCLSALSTVSASSPGPATFAPLNDVALAELTVVAFASAPLESIDAGSALGTSLRRLEVRQSELADLSVLQRFDALEELSLYGNEITDLAPLAAESFAQLQRLELSRNQLTDLSPVARLEQLRILVANENHIERADGLRLPNLTQLTLGTNALQSFAESSLPRLVDLSLGGNVLVAVPDLSRSPSLERLFLSNNQITSLEGVSACPELRVLEAEGNPLSHLDGLESLSALQELSLAATRVADVQSIAALAGLQRLNLSGTAVNDLTPVSGLQAIGTLFLGDSLISDLSPLEAWTMEPRCGLLELSGLELDAHSVSVVLPALCAAGFAILGTDQIDCPPMGC